ncbi:cysteine hydrolase family protein [Desulfatiglans anilini]|uniref:cysteine hydrolase family protein n=1 Tax=Desulfatiglans anilini TaxID=90728 RepID=UPI0003F5D93B|nr:cysteine hydrolase [Desulfatiglans anilini]
MITLNAEPEAISLERARSALVIVDMQNAFLRPEGYFGMLGVDLEEVPSVIDRCRRLADACRRSSIQIIYLKMVYPGETERSKIVNTPLFYKSKTFRLAKDQPDILKRLPLEGSWGIDIIDELTPHSEDLVIVKERHDGFVGTNFQIHLSQKRIKSLIFAGTATNVCVESTLRHAAALDYFATLVADATSPLGSHELHEATISNVKASFGWVTDTQSVLAALQYPDQSPTGSDFPEATLL